MEADILRLILFLVGTAVIFGIYAADRYKRGVEDDQSEDWASQPHGEDSGRSKHIEPRWDRLYEQEESQVADDQPIENHLAEEIPEEDSSTATHEEELTQSDLQELYSEVDKLESSESNPVDDAINSELGQLEEILHEDPRYDPEYKDESDSGMPKEQMSISFFNREAAKESPQGNAPELPTKIIQLNVVPHEEFFYGDDILSIANEVGLEPGDMNIFHHFGDDPERRQAVYSMASMVEPGTFPMDDMDGFSTPGVTLFSTLPGPKDGLSIFTDMLYAAEQLANLLDGELRDETHSAITKQTIGHIREDIQEYHRQLQLARSKR
jgi:cell division protein ZipA